MFHHRAVGLRMVLGFYMETGKQVRDQYIRMASHIPITYLGKLERKDAVAKSLGLTISIAASIRETTLGRFDVPD